jgi:hypothetical protein
MPDWTPEPPAKIEAAEIPMKEVACGGGMAGKNERRRALLELSACISVDHARRPCSGFVRCASPSYGSRRRTPHQMAALAAVTGQTPMQSAHRHRIAVTRPFSPRTRIST